MNRTSLCIKMLLLLKSRGKMNTKALADELETNPRNIREFRRELEIAGYNIKETKGRYGGYELDEDDLFPVIRLTKEEVSALDEARHFVTSHKEYPLIKEYNNALDKIMQMFKNESRSKNYFMDVPGNLMSASEQEYLQTLNQAMEQGLCVELTYQNAKESEPHTFLLDAYEILHYHQAYYVAGFSHRRNDIRIFRISEQRMFDCVLTERKFLKDSNFKLDMYIGKHSIIKGNFVRIVVKVDQSKRRMFKEEYWGFSFEEEYHEEYSIFSFLVEDVLDLYRKLFSFGDTIEILEPSECREGFMMNLKATLNKYK